MFLLICACNMILNKHTCLVSTQRRAEAGELSTWSKMRQNTRRYLKRLKDDSHEWLNSMKLWRGDIHLIEGEWGELCPQPYCYFSSRWMVTDLLTKISPSFDICKGCSAQASCLTSPSCASWSCSTWSSSCSCSASSCYPSLLPPTPQGISPTTRTTVREVSLVLSLQLCVA